MTMRRNRTDEIWGDVKIYKNAANSKTESQAEIVLEPEFFEKFNFKKGDKIIVRRLAQRIFIEKNLQDGYTLNVKKTKATNKEISEQLRCTLTEKKARQNLMGIIIPEGGLHFLAGTEMDEQGRITLRHMEA